MSATIAVSEQRELEVQREGERLHQQAETTGKQNVTESTAAEEQTMATLKLQTERKVKTAEGYVVDLVVEAPGRRRRVGIEVDGPQQFKGRFSREATGATRLKKRQVRAFSPLPIMTVPYWEWETLCLGDDATALRKRLSTLDVRFVAHRQIAKLDHVCRDEPAREGVRHVPVSDETDAHLICFRSFETRRALTTTRREFARLRRRSSRCAEQSGDITAA